MSRLGIRRRLLLVVVATLTVAMAALVAGYNVVLARNLDHSASDLARSRAEARVASLHVAGGELQVGEAPDEAAADAYLWVFAGNRVLEQPRVATAVARAAHSLASGARRFLDVADTRLYADPVVSDGRRVGTVVAGVSLAPYEETRGTTLVSSLVFGGVVILFVGAAAWWLLGASLRPVGRMTRQAAAWSEQDLDHRFALGPPHDELTELAATLDALLDRLAASLRRERRFSAELSHELRTPLSRVLAESELALRRERAPEEYRHALETIHRSADQLSRTVDALVAAARYESGGERGRSDAEAAAAGAVAACGALASSRQVDVELVPPPHPLRIGVEADLAERILQPVVENACRYGSSHVSITMARENSSVVYTIDDDGPGLGADEQERIFEPGVRGTATNGDGLPGAGLGLALARRLARSVDGDVVTDTTTDFGRFRIRLPTG
jgi:signal transduction histidine kinase